MNDRIAKELDYFLYGSYEPKRFPNSNQVRDEHTGLLVLDWKCWVNKPEYKVEMVKHFYDLALKDIKQEIMTLKSKCDCSDIGIEQNEVLSDVISIIENKEQLLY